MEKNIGQENAHGERNYLDHDGNASRYQGKSGRQQQVVQPVDTLLMATNLLLQPYLALTNESNLTVLL